MDLDSGMEWDLVMPSVKVKRFELKLALAMELAMELELELGSLLL